jgi:hypothetical protein
MPTPLVGQFTQMQQELYRWALQQAKKTQLPCDPDSVGKRVAIREMQLRHETQERGDADIITPLSAISPEQRDWILETINLRAKVGRLDENGTN